jgi:dihydrofolate synthase/folylpolyglutamate synthase
MTYDDATAFWFGRINYEVKAAAPEDLKLERMRAFLRRLGDPHDRLRIVHITGTKGKGSTAAMLGSVLQAAGYRVGLFTSPHLGSVEERMQVNGAPITREEFTTLMEQVAPAVRALEAESDQSPTFFEISTALGMLHFLHRRVDVAILEVGLGGRFDSTNVCRPLVSIITTVGHDHMAQLGNAVEEIAYQKAGIIKRGVPVVCGVQDAAARRVIDAVAREMSAEVRSPSGAFPYEVGLLGAHQIDNAKLAALTVEVLNSRGFTIPAAALAKGLKEVRWPCRIEVVARDPLVVLDCAHNVPSAQALADTLVESLPVSGRRSLVFAVSCDKDYPAMLRIIAPLFDDFYFCRYGNNPRCAAPGRLAEALAEIAPGKVGHTFEASKDAWDAAWAAIGAADGLCVTGSVFLAGELQENVRRAARGRSVAVRSG